MLTNGKRWHKVLRVPGCRRALLQQVYRQHKERLSRAPSQTCDMRKRLPTKSIRCDQTKMAYPTSLGLCARDHNPQLIIWHFSTLRPSERRCGYVHMTFDPSTSLPQRQHCLSTASSGSLSLFFGGVMV